MEKIPQHYFIRSAKKNGVKNMNDFYKAFDIYITSSNKKEIENKLKMYSKTMAKRINIILKKMPEIIDDASIMYKGVTRDELELMELKRDFKYNNDIMEIHNSLKKSPKKKKLKRRRSNSNENLETMFRGLEIKKRPKRSKKKKANLKRTSSSKKVKSPKKFAPGVKSEKKKQKRPKRWVRMFNKNKKENEILKAFEKMNI